VSDDPELEVLVVSYNSAAALRACLASIEREVPGTPVAIREHGTDASASAALDALVADHPAPVRVERDPSNPGFGAGCNALAAGSSAGWLLFLNPDAEILTWPWAGSHLPSRAVVGPEISGSGAPAKHWGVDFRVRDEIARSWLRRTGVRPRGTGFVSGAAMLIGRQELEAVGGFDPAYFLFYEDIDLCMRANRIGISTLVEPRWTVRHTGAHSTRATFGRSLIWSYESAVRFHATHGHAVAGYRAYVLVDSLARAAIHAMRRSVVDSAAYIGLARRTWRDMIRFARV
jgi:N-acetylglucosaminyl-diphospho-decaprenol L-rhamnosyltransferase